MASGSATIDLSYRNTYEYNFKNGYYKDAVEIAKRDKLDEDKLVQALAKEFERYAYCTNRGQYYFEYNDEFNALTAGVSREQIRIAAVIAFKCLIGEDYIEEMAKLAVICRLDDTAATDIIKSMPAEEVQNCS
jgi:hypothetical protein